MRDAFEKIAEIARKESHTGYGDYAVFGGFSAFIEELLAKDEDEDAQLLKGVVRHYADSNLRTRKAIIDLVLKLIRDFQATEDVLAKEASESVASPERKGILKDAPCVAALSSVPTGKELSVGAEGVSGQDIAKSKSVKVTGNVKKAGVETVCAIKGIGPQKAKLLEKLGIYTVADLCAYYPYRHEDRRFITEIASLVDGESALISGYVDRAELSHIRNNLRIVKARLTDGSGYLTVVWFNQPWLKQQLYDGREVTVYGKVERRNGRVSMTASEYELKRSNEGFGILPVYGLTTGLNQKNMRSFVAAALEIGGEQIEEIFPESFCRRYGLENRRQAVLDYHFPKDFKSLQLSHRRLVFEEFFLFRLSFELKHRGEGKKGISMLRGDESAFYDLLSFSPTGAQKKAIGEIYNDMAEPRMMNRLLEGDVGSGKTVVAAAAVYRCVASGHQCALMAPTEILAEQHYQSMRKTFEKTGMRIGLLTGSSKAAEKRRLSEELSDGRLDLLIGTHALIENTAVFCDLALVIIDEQHRFGVNQRNALFMKGSAPDLLVMTATPIPRTLAMTVFSGLDLSVLDEMPPGRKPIRTMVVTEDQEDRVLRFMKKHVAIGHQCYVICPLVEESEQLDAESATRFYQQLKQRDLKGISVGLVHGKMKAWEKEGVLEKFRKNEISVLVSTTVIEVGIDVPNATVMFVKNADRFGLAQLHQIRGRIGRGEASSTCILQTSGQNEISLQRLKVMETYSDGFKIAEEDLKLRGPGDFFGVRQHGLPEMNLADLFRDHELLREAAGAVEHLLKEDPELTDASWRKTKELIHKKMESLR